MKHDIAVTTVDVVAHKLRLLDGADIIGQSVKDANQDLQSLSTVHLGW